LIEKNGYVDRNDKVILKEKRDIIKIKAKNKKVDLFVITMYKCTSSNKLMISLVGADM